MPIQRTGNIVTIPILNDLIFTLLYNSTSEQRRGLQNYYLKQIESQAKLRNFCTTSSREEKEEILSHFGFRFFYVVMHKDITGLEKFYEQIKQSGPHDGIRSAIYIHGNEQFSYYLNLYAKSVHHPNYFLNFQILRTGYHIHNWGRNNVNTENMEVREMIESETLVMRTLLSANVMMHMFSGATGLTMPHIHILMYLYIKRHIYVPRAALVSFFKGFGPYNKARYVLVCMQELWTEKYVERGLDKKSYTITARGVKKISEFRDQVLTFNQMF
jgi:hypothetical protein